MMLLFKKIKKFKKIAKVPLVVQLEALECSAACLSMILAYYKKFVPLEQLRIDCCVTKHGSNAKNLVDAAQIHGLKAWGVKIEAEELKKNGHFPCIIHWNFNHFVVLAGFKGKKAIIYDPAAGAYVVDASNFNSNFTGICLNFTPTKNFKPDGKPKTATKFFAHILKNTIPAFSFFFIVSFLTLAINLIKPGFLHFFIDIILNNKNKTWLLGFSFTTIATAATSLTLVWLKTVHFPKIEGKLSAIGNCKFIWRMLNLPLEFFSGRLTGEIQMRQNLNASIAKQIMKQITPLVLSSVNTIIILLVMLRFSVFLTTVVSLTSLIATLICKFSSKKQLNLEKIVLKSEGKLCSMLLAGLNSIESIKINGAENQFFQNWANAQAVLNHQIAKCPPLATLPKFITSLSSKAIFVVGAFLLITNNNLTSGMIISCNMLLELMMKPFNNFLNTQQSLQSIKTKIERVEDVMNFKVNKSVPKNKPTKTLNKLSGKIEIKNLKYSHIGERNAIFNGLSFKIKPGEKVALIGPPGCGKTTLIKLLTGLLTQQQGQILFDGHEIDEIEKNVFRGCVAVVSHNTFFFQDTIKNNLKMWNKTVDDMKLIEAANKAQISREIDLHGGFDSKILEHAHNFSKGQKQQLDIARALALNPSILILDEATSAIDLKTETKIFEQIFKEKFSCIVATSPDKLNGFLTHFAKVVQL